MELGARALRLIALSGMLLLSWFMMAVVVMP